MLRHDHGKIMEKSWHGSHVFPNRKTFRFSRNTNCHQIGTLDWLQGMFEIWKPDYLQFSEKWYSVPHCSTTQWLQCRHLSLALHPSWARNKEWTCTPPICWGSETSGVGAWCELYSQDGNSMLTHWQLLLKKFPVLKGCPFPITCHTRRRFWSKQVIWWAIKAPRSTNMISAWLPCMTKLEHTDAVKQIMGYHDHVQNLAMKFHEIGLHYLRCRHLIIDHLVVNMVP